MILKNNKYFLFGCDSCEIVTKLYLKFTKDYPEKTKNMILITSDSKFDIDDASEDFKNKWVFYSPSIITGIDFSIETKQNQYIYVKGDSISPSSIYQQSTRNRNIDKLYYYVDVKEHESKYESFEDVKEKYKTLIEINHKINNICKQFNENEETYINENMFFNIFCYNEYIFDIYNTNKKMHYELILKTNGFILECEGDDMKIKLKTKKELETLYKSIDLVEEYLNDVSDDKDNKDKYQDLIKNIQLFDLQTEQDIIKYKDFLNDKFKRNQFFNYIKLFNYDGINIKENKNSYDVKNITTTNEKIKIIYKLYNDHAIKYLSLDEFDKIKDVKMTDDEFMYIKKLFRSEKEKPNNKNELKYLIIGCIKNLIGNLGIIETKQEKNNNISVYHYNYSNKIEIIKSLHSKII